MTTKSPSNGPDFVDQMAAEPVSYDWFFRRKPANISDARLRELIEIERERRIAVITAKEQK